MDEITMLAICFNCNRMFTGEKQEIRDSLFSYCPKCNGKISLASTADMIIEQIEELEELKNQEDIEGEV